MAKKSTLPNTDLEVVEKYPSGKRLDFQNFGSVCKTTYAKGVITDFKKLKDDPITVESMVKVTGAFGESEYIPIFYHPKKDYWDKTLADPAVLATDFDEETGAFKQAWMSFRSGDEVVVMLKEGVPVAIVAHADGVPRIGEDVFKTTAMMEHLHVRASLATDYLLLYGLDEEDKGPDGIDLGLKMECARIPISVDEVASDIDNTYHSNAGFTYGDLSYTATLSGGWWTVHWSYNWYDNWYPITITTLRYNTKYHYLIPLGPILYVLVQRTVRVVVKWHYNDIYTYLYLVDSGNSPPLDEAGKDAFIAELIAKMSTQPTVKPTDYETGGTSYTHASMSAAVYNEDTYKAAKTEAMDGFTEQPLLTAEVDGPFSGVGDIMYPDVKITVRPHTKTELQVCGLWPT